MAEPRDPDRENLERWRAGDAACGRALFGRYFEQLHRFFGNKVNEPDELVQATFVALLKTKTAFEGRSSFRTYLFTIARHELYRHLRTLQRERQFDPEVSSIAQIATSAGGKLARSEEHRRLCATLRTLPIEQQTLLELHYWEDLDAAALAEVLDAPVGTIRVRLHRARAALRDAMIANEAAPLEALASVDSLDTWARRAAG